MLGYILLFLGSLCLWGNGAYLAKFDKDDKNSAAGWFLGFVLAVSLVVISQLV